MAQQEFGIGRKNDQKPGLENRGERSLKGKVALVTGSSRDIGAEIAAALAENGVCIIGNYLKETKKAERVRMGIEQRDGIAEFVQADITIAGERQRFIKLLDKSFGGKLDFVVLNTSGNSETARAVCVEANNALVDEFLPRINEGGKIVLMQSVPGHFAPELRELGKMPSFYDLIAGAKYEGETLLRLRIPEFQKNGVSLIVVCPPEVEDTLNMQVFKRRDKSISEKHAEISDILGIRRAVTIREVGEKVVELLKRKDLQQGYIEFFRKL